MVGSALRDLRRSPATAALIVLTVGVAAAPLALAVSLARRPSLANAGVRAPGELVRIEASLLDGGRYTRAGQLSFPEFQAIQRDAHSLVAVAASYSLEASLEVAGERQRVTVGFVTDAYFSLLGVRVTSPEGVPAATRRGGDSNEPIAVVAEPLWTLLFPDGASATSHVVHLNGVPVRVGGRVEGRFFGLESGRPERIWLPLSLQPLFASDVPALDAWDAQVFAAIGRSPPGLPAARVQEDLRRLSELLEEAQPSSMRGRRFSVVSATETRSAVGPARSLNAAIALLAGLLVAVACVNASGLLLARAVRTAHGTAVRMAMGMSAQRLQVTGFIQALALAGAGVATAALLSAWLVGLVRSFVPDVPTATWDAQFAAATAAISMLVACLLAISPALFWHRMPLGRTLAEGSPGESPQRATASRALLTLQVATSLAVCYTAFSLGASVESLRQADPGFSTTGLVGTPLDLRSTRAPRSRAEVDALKARLPLDVAGLPGVASAGLGLLPLLLNAASVTNVVRGDDERDHRVAVDVVGPGYFETLGIAVLAGSDFDANGARGDELIVNATLAQAFWPERGAVGEMLRLVDRDGSLRALRVRGVVADTKPDFVGLPVEARIYKSALVEPFVLGHLYVRVHGGLPAMRAIDSTVKALVPGATTAVISSPVEENRRQSLRFLDAALAIARLLGVITLVLAVAGIYAQQHYLISRRRREFGIRLALGARPRHLVALVGRDAGVAVVAGAGLGLPIALALGSFSSSVVPGFVAVNPSALAGAVGVLGAAVSGASIAPLLGALRVNPLDAIRRG